MAYFAPWSQALLDIVLYVKATREFFFQTHNLLRTFPNGEWLSATRKAYDELPDVVFQKAGILHNNENFEKMLIDPVPEYVMDCEDEDMHLLLSGFVARKEKTS